MLKVGRQRADLGYRMKALEADAARAAVEGAAAEARLADEQRHADDVSAALAALVLQLAELDREQTDDRARHMELVRDGASNRSTADAYLTQVNRLQKEYTRKLADGEHRASQRAALAQRARRAVAGRRRRSGATRRGARADRRAERRPATPSPTSAADVQTRLEGLRVRQGDLRGRIDVLEDLERSLEGLGAGVREVVGRISVSPDSAILGLVADLLTVPREVAPLVELALGDTAQRFVVRSPEAVDAVAAAVGEVAGRVGFVPLVRRENLPPGPPP